MQYEHGLIDAHPPGKLPTPPEPPPSVEGLGRDTSLTSRAASLASWSRPAFAAPSSSPAWQGHSYWPGCLARCWPWSKGPPFAAYRAPASPATSAAASGSALAMPCSIDACAASPKSSGPVCGVLAAGPFPSRHQRTPLVGKLVVGQIALPGDQSPRSLESGALGGDLGCTSPRPLTRVLRAPCGNRGALRSGPAGHTICPLGESRPSRYTIGRKACALRSLGRFTSLLRPLPRLATPVSRGTQRIPGADG